jgi:hypothetical protein
MKRIRLFIALILTLSILLINVKPALAVPLTPSEFYGTVTINGITSTTAIVVGRIAGVQYGGAAIWDCVTLPYCTYVLTVPSDDSDTTGTIEGGVEGNTVDFYVNGAKAVQTGTWHSGGLPVLLNLTVTSNVAPVITEGASTTVTMSEDGSPTAFSLTLHATDANTGDTLTWSISTAASHGTATASGTGASKAIGYTPTANYNGTDSFVVRVSDGSLTDTITVNVTITAVINPPGTFNKTSPANAATGVATNPTLSWAASSSAASYEYCYATTSGCTSWISAGTSTSAALSGLLNEQIYYWQVRAVNPDGNTLANAGAYWSFTTAALTPPGIFSKLLPADAATSVATTPVLSWGTSSNATSYEYCYATTFGCTSWISVGASTTATFSGLSNEQTYYWQIRAVNAGGITLANAGTYWSFTTVVTPPGAFSKTSPANGATGVATTPTLSWGTSRGAASYDYCYATTTGCTSWISTGTATSAALSGLSNEQIYYWRVRAVNAGGSTLANAGAYWSFTTAVKPPSFTIFLPMVTR